MTTLQGLTLKRNAALGKLTTLQRRADRLAGPPAPVVASALAELESALEEINVATEQLQMHLDELAGARQEADAVRALLREFLDVLPVPCLWTDSTGQIDDANAAAAELLNVSAQRLHGRPFIHFLADREAFEQALAALNRAVSRTVVIETLVRPRERRPRAVGLTGQRLGSDARYCWFLGAGGSIPGVEPA